MEVSTYQNAHSSWLQQEWMSWSREALFSDQIDPPGIDSLKNASKEPETELIWNHFLNIAVYSLSISCKRYDTYRPDNPQGRRNSLLTRLHLQLSPAQ
jgi:hypothetical protein